MFHFQVHSVAVGRILSRIVWWTKSPSFLLYGSLQHYIFSHQREQARTWENKRTNKKYWPERKRGLFLTQSMKLHVSFLLYSVSKKQDTLYSFQPTLNGRCLYKGISTRDLDHHDPCQNCQDKTWSLVIVVYYVRNWANNIQHNPQNNLDRHFFLFLPLTKGQLWLKDFTWSCYY